MKAYLNRAAKRLRLSHPSNFKRLPNLLNRTSRRYFAGQEYYSSQELLAKLRNNTLTREDIQTVLEEKRRAEAELDRHMNPQESGGNEPSNERREGLVSQVAGTDKMTPLYIERVGERRLAPLIGSIIFWSILLAVYIHFQRRNANLGGIMGDDNYNEYDEISWEDEESENEEEKKDEPDEWEQQRRSWLERLGISVGTDREVINEESGMPKRRKMKRVTFDDVCGCQEAKTDLEDLVHYLKHPEKFKEMGVKLPKGVLLEGPPGTGKTLMARALAGEAKVPFLSTNGSSFDQIFVGIGVMRVKNLFNRAKQLAPCIVFIDEIDAVGSTRNTVSTSPHASDSLNALLVEMDGFEENNGVIVLAATNMAERLDSALVRAGRFDRTIRVPLPDKATRKEIIDHYLGDRGTGDISTEDLVSDLAGFSGADLSNLVNLAGIEAVKQDLTKIGMNNLVEAKETIAMGRARTSMVIPLKEKRLTAYHEGGHAIVALYTKGANPIYKATLLPRGPALGMVTFTQKDEYSKTKESLLAELDVAMGGRAAEDLIFGDANVTTGASSDFNQATQLATRMVTQYGMSPEVGQVYYPAKNIPKLSPELQNLINGQVKNLLDASYARAKATLLEHSDELEKLAQGLLKDETLTVDQIKALLGWEEDQVVSPMQSPPSPVEEKISKKKKPSKGNKFRGRGGDVLTVPDKKKLPSLTPAIDMPIPQGVLRTPDSPS